MRVPLSWLRDYVDFDLPPERLAERLTLLGMEVGSIDRIGTEWTSVVVGELLEVMPHPNAQRLSLTRVRVSDHDQPLSIVCGATNIAVGQRVPVALPGAVLPGGRRIGVSTIQGSESQGMLCSGAELGLTTDADGILILSADKDLRPLTLGTPLADVVGDVVLDVDVKPNRGDALSLIGLAREVAAISGSEVRWPKIRVPETGDSTADHVSVEVEDAQLCSRFVARYVDGLKIGPSPVRVQLRLAAAGMRPVSNAVDASNYVMLELGKPIHVFDAAAVETGRITVRPARAGEHIETLDHVDRTLTPDTLLIADPRGPIGIAGVMGGAQSEIGPATTAAIVESAIFDPVSIRRTAQRFGLRSEASLRFEKGQESRLARLGADRTAQLLAEWAAGRPAVGAVDTNPVDDQPRRVAFRPARVSRLLGEEVATRDMTAALARIGIPTEHPHAEDRLVIIEGEKTDLPTGRSEALVAIVPPHRRDLVVEADVAEEICRLRGYEDLPPRLPDTVMPGYRPDPRRMVDQLRDLLAGRGLAEVVTNALIGPVDHAHLGIPADDAATIRVANPVTGDHSELRRSMLPGLVGVLGRNERQRWPDLALFEVGSIHSWLDGKPVETPQLAILVTGAARPASPYEATRDATVEDVKGVVEWVASRLRIGRLAYQRPAVTLAAVEHPGRTAVVLGTADGKPVELGRVGELDPRYLAAYELRTQRAAFAVLDLGLLAGLAPGLAQVREIAHLPAVERDIAVVVSRDVAAGDVAAVIEHHARPLLAALTLFDRYQGAPLEADEISLAYRLRFQPMDAPLEEGDLDRTIDQIGTALASELGGRIRSGS
jgi:phenylalanyl-tRNA synthetase beta chain